MADDTSQPFKGVPFDVGFFIYSSETGKVMSSVTGMTARIVCDAHPAGARTDNDPTMVDTTGGACSITLSSAEMDSDMITLKITTQDAEAMDFTCTLYPVTSAVSEEVTWSYVLTSSTDGSPIHDANIWITTDVVGTNTVATATTDANGSATFSLVPGTYYVWRSKVGWSFVNPDTEVVS